MIDIFIIFVGMLAVWRLTHMLQEENGPKGIFLRFQAWAAKKDTGPGSVGDGMTCFYCMSVWWSVLVALLIEHNNIGLFLLYALAISTGSIFINLLHNKLEQ